MPETLAAIRAARWAVASLLLLTALLAGCGRTHGPRFDQTLRLVTIDLEGDRQTLPRPVLAEYIRVLRDWAPDVVFLQGVRQDRDLPGGWIDVRTLASELGLPHVMGAPEEGSELRYRDNTAAVLPALAIVSRYPLRDRVEIGYRPTEADSSTSDPAWDPTEPERLLLLGATIMWGGKPVRMWTTRLADDPLGAVQFAQVVELLRVTREAGEPSMTIGRFPIPPRLEPMRLLQEEWRDAWGEAGSGLGYTHSSPVPRARESMVFMSKRSELRVLKIFPVGILMGPGRGLPLLAELRFEAAPPTMMERIRQRDDAPQPPASQKQSPPPMPGAPDPAGSDAAPPSAAASSATEAAAPRGLSPAMRSLVPRSPAPQDRASPDPRSPNRSLTPPVSPDRRPVQGDEPASSTRWEELLDRYQP